MTGGGLWPPRGAASAERRSRRRRQALLLLVGAGALLQVALLGPSSCWLSPATWAHEPAPPPEDQGVPDVPLEAPVSLTVSSPAVLLNHIADRYSSTTRILMEFIDNSLDDAENFFDAVANSYERPVTVEVLVDREAGALRITDNCRGMDPEMLRRVTTHVGESQKRGQSFVNGQFGFGMQAFRACCHRLKVRSRTNPGVPALEIEIERNQSFGFSLREVTDGEDGHAMPETGTMVALEGIESEWASDDNDISIEAIAEEVELHFERLLSRSNLEVSIVDGATGQRHVCKPVAYADEDTLVVVNDTIDLGSGQVARTLLVVGSPERAEELRRPARFFVKGRRIGKTSEIRTFFMGSKHRWTVWNNPQVMGYIDVIGSDAGPLRPVITRDEFKTSQGRKAAFKQIMDTCEEPMLEAIAVANTQRNDKSMKGLEDALTSALSRISSEERKARKGGGAPRAHAKGEALPLLPGLRPLPPPPPLKPRAEAPETLPLELRDVPYPDDEEAAPERKPPKKEKQSRKKREPKKVLLRSDDFRVKLVKGLPQAQGSSDPPRSVLSGNEILVDVTHPDFKTRWKKSRSGAPRIDERVCGYLASVVSAHYRDASYEEFNESPESRLDAYQDMIGTFCSLEDKLRSVMPALAQEMENLYAIEEA